MSVSQEKVRLVISIAGPVRSGKTSIAALVSRLLEQAGIAVTTSDPDLDSGRVPPDLDRCLAALAGKVEAEVVTVSTLKPGDGPLSAPRGLPWSRAYYGQAMAVRGDEAYNLATRPTAMCQADFILRIDGRILKNRFTGAQSLAELDAELEERPLDLTVRRAVKAAKTAIRAFEEESLAGR